MSKPTKRPRKRDARASAQQAERAACGPLQPEAVRRKAIEYCLFHYPTLYTGGVPARSAAVWMVPVLLEDPDAGISARVGELRIDAQSGEVIAAPAAQEVIAAGQCHYQEARDDRSASAAPGKNR